jgi:hypothetical protein
MPQPTDRQGPPVERAPPVEKHFNRKPRKFPVTTAGLRTKIQTRNSWIRSRHSNHYTMILLWRCYTALCGVETYSYHKQIRNVNLHLVHYVRSNYIPYSIAVCNYWTVIKILHVLIWTKMCPMITVFCDVTHWHMCTNIWRSLLLLHSTLKMEALSFSKTLVPLYEIQSITSQKTVSY